MARTKKSPEERRRMMAGFKGRNTNPELVVRRSAHEMGYRFRLQRRDVPGTPDLVFVSRRKVIFVHGCFWHGHGCKLTRVPKSNVAYWASKFERNRIRDEKTLKAVAAAGWKYLVVWECEIQDHEALQRRLRSFLEQNRSSAVDR